ncbi:ribonuclease T2 [Amaricoccus sp.]|uniref:ribonuclease T2 n=1 Tax=Amaricoccus sp. TaxID=1872485 RepID=UPI002628AD70|nr:ribonuclease T2 [Amaricoccus sp.]HRO11274.1 ribonuclease T2 [Amaricoccus sp.]
MIKWFSLGLGLVAMSASAAERPFDYYLLALTWTPSWCAAEGNPGEGQCDPRRDLGFTVHGLWPQYEAGWPEDCASAEADPSRRETAAMADVMGSGSLAWYQWKKHGRCAGLPARDYFGLIRRLHDALDLPRPGEGRATAAGLEAAILAANPALSSDGVIVTCRGGRIAEVRICLTPELAPRACGADVLADACRSRGPQEMPPVP